MASLAPPWLRRASPEGTPDGAGALVAAVRVIRPFLAPVFPPFVRLLGRGRPLRASPQRAVVRRQ